jgi:hypothetical protein
MGVLSVCAEAAAGRLDGLLGVARLIEIGTFEYFNQREMRNGRKHFWGKLGAKSGRKRGKMEVYQFWSQAASAATRNRF